MSTVQTFSYDSNPLPAPTPAAPPAPGDLGLLAGLAGTWTGTGFNAIWRPNQLSTGQDRFLELNLTNETLEFDPVGGGIPNRGLLQPDIQMAALRYLQTIADANLQPPGNGLHLEPGIWLNVPATTDPPVSASVARLASIPHGTTVLAQGVASQGDSGPVIPAINLNPFPIGSPAEASTFPEQNLQTQTNFRTGAPGINGIEQPMVDNPNSVLTTALQGQTVASTITLQVATNDLPVTGGGTENTAFLGGGSDGPNANAVSVSATFWLEIVTAPESFQQLQYSQTVLLNFNGLSWPHVTVATLRQATE